MSVDVLAACKEKDWNSTNKLLVEKVELLL